MPQIPADTANALSDLSEKVAELRQQFDELKQKQFKPAIASAASVAKAAVSDADRITAEKAELLGSKVKESPLKAIGIAVVVGYAIAAILR